MTFKFYLDHTEPIFADSKILNLYKLSDYYTCQFIFRYFNFQNLPEIFTDYFRRTKIYTIITQEMHQCCTKTVIGQTVKSEHLLIKELIYGTIFLHI